MVELSVALPMYKAKHIAWLAMEGLCRQKNVHFEWELMVAEERYLKAFGRHKVHSYEQRLREIGCRRIHYIGLDFWVPLPVKCLLIGKELSPSSKCTLLQAADDYPQPWRLKDAYDAFEKGVDWFYSKKGVYYKIFNGKILLYDHSCSQHVSGVEMAVRSDLMRNLPLSFQRTSIDHWLFMSMQATKGSPLVTEFNKTDHWKYSLYTDGMNIQAGAGFECYDNPPEDAAFKKIEPEVLQHIPEGILQRLRMCRRYISRWKLPKNISSIVFRIKFLLAKIYLAGKV